MRRELWTLTCCIVGWQSWLACFVSNASFWNQLPKTAPETFERNPFLVSSCLLVSSMACVDRIKEWGDLHCNVPLAISWNVAESKILWGRAIEYQYHFLKTIWSEVCQLWTNGSRNICNYDTPPPYNGLHDYDLVDQSYSMNSHYIIPHTLSTTYTLNPQSTEIDVITFDEPQKPHVHAPRF